MDRKRVSMDLSDLLVWIQTGTDDDDSIEMNEWNGMEFTFEWDDSDTVM